MTTFSQQGGNEITEFVMPMRRLSTMTPAGYVLLRSPGHTHTSVAYGQGANDNEVLMHYKCRPVEGEVMFSNRKSSKPT